MKRHLKIEQRRGVIRQVKAVTLDEQHDGCCCKRFADTSDTEAGIGLNGVTSV